MISSSSSPSASLTGSRGFDSNFWVDHRCSSVAGWKKLCRGLDERVSACVRFWGEAEEDFARRGSGEGDVRRLFGGGPGAMELKLGETERRTGVYLDNDLQPPAP
jgi:hypothetical protein